MTHVVHWLKSGLLMLGFALAAIVALVLFAVAAVAVRPLILGLLLAVLAAAVISIFSPSFRAWFETLGERETHHSGLRLATDVAVHPSHSWARFLGSKQVAVGADDFVQAALGPVEAVDLPTLGSRVEQGQRLFSLRRGARSVAVRAPVSGTVIERNESLLARPETVNGAPFTGGWVVRLRGENVRTEASRLLQGKQARGWFRGEIDRLMTTVLADEALTPTLPDGGALSGELYRHIDDGAWTKLTKAFFDRDES